MSVRLTGSLYPVTRFSPASPLSLGSPPTLRPPAVGPGQVPRPRLGLFQGGLGLFVGSPVEGQSRSGSYFGSDVSHRGTCPSGRGAARGSKTFGFPTDLGRLLLHRCRRLFSTKEKGRTLSHRLFSLLFYYGVRLPSPTQGASTSPAAFDGPVRRCRRPISSPAFCLRQSRLERHLASGGGRLG